MKKYKLLKDLPTFKAGQTFVLLAEYEKKLCYNKTFGETIYRQPGLYMVDDNGKIAVLAYHQTTLDKFPNILDEWFEEVAENKVWKPKFKDVFYYLVANCGIHRGMNTQNGFEEMVMSIGNCFRTIEDAEKAVEKLKALRRLREKGLRFRHAKRFLDFDSDGHISFIFSTEVARGMKDGPAFPDEIQKDLDLLFKEESEDEN